MTKRNTRVRQNERHLIWSKVCYNLSPMKLVSFAVLEVFDIQEGDKLETMKRLRA